MKKINILLFVLTLLTSNVNAQFKIISNGEARLWTNNMGPWDNSMVTYANNDYSKLYVVERSGTHSFYVLGSGYIVARGSYVNSDEKIKKEIKNIENIDSLFLLQAKTYKLISPQDSTSLVFNIDNGENQSVSSNIDLKQYGFIAQEVRKIYPELVFEDENGLLSINYVAFIPLLIEAVKQQKNHIEELQTIVYSQEKELIELKNTVDFASIENATTSINETISDNSKLFDNVPNPFSINTEIKFRIPENSTSAKLIIHDMQGIELMSFVITQKGLGSIIIHGSELKAGMYLYTLLVDNKIIDTKRMLLTKE